MRAWFFVLLIATASQAQPVAPSAELTSRQRTLLTVGGAGAGLGTVIGVGYALGEDVNSVEGVALLVALYPVGTTIAVQAISALFGTDADWRETAIDSAVGVPLGAAAGALAGGAAYGLSYLSSDRTESVTLGVEIVGVLVGGGVALGVASTWAARRVGPSHVQVAPAALAAPTGERGAGLSLRLGL